MTSTPDSSLLPYLEQESPLCPTVRDVQLPSGRRLALITLVGDGRSPTTMGATGLAELAEILSDLSRRAAAGDLDAVGVTGRPGVFAAGADLTQLRRLSPDAALQMGRLGHDALSRMGTLGVPSFALLSGLALGGGLELALHCNYRTAAADAGPFGLPEVSLGLVPGWGGTYLLPRLVGIDTAIDVIVRHPLRRGRTLTAQQAHDVGIIDRVFPQVRFLEDSLQWADAILTRKTPTPVRAQHNLEPAHCTAAVMSARNALGDRSGSGPNAPWVALDLLELAAAGQRDEAFTREDQALAALICSDEFAASSYAFNLTRSTSESSGIAGRAISRVGVIGAGLMATQFALLFIRTLRVPVILTDIDQKRVDRGVAAVHNEIGKLLEEQAATEDEANRLRGLISGTSDLSQFAGCDFVIEAVFEDLAVKRSVLAAVETHVADDAVLATNTSSLSVTDIGSDLCHPARLIGFHFFNPVAVMPLIEVVNTPATDATTVATAMQVARLLGKTPVPTADAPGFVVNRLLAVVMGEAARALDAGTPVVDVEQALSPLALPMGPFQLMQLIGWKVSAHMLDTMAAAFPDRFHSSVNLHRLADVGAALTIVKGRVTGWNDATPAVLTVGSTPASSEQLLRRTQDGLTREVSMILADHVVKSAQDVDLCLILGARWPRHHGGLTPWLDATGSAARLLGTTFHHPTVAGTRLPALTAIGTS